MSGLSDDDVFTTKALASLTATTSNVCTKCLLDDLLTLKTYYLQLLYRYRNLSQCAGQWIYRTLLTIQISQIFLGPLFKCVRWVRIQFTVPTVFQGSIIAVLIHRSGLLARALRDPSSAVTTDT